MGKYTPEQTADIVELEQLVAQWGYELDFNMSDDDGRGVATLFTDDCAVDMGPVTYKGLDALRKFYTDRNVRVRAQQKDGIRTQRHGISLVRIVLHGNGRATGTFTIINFSGEGKGPIVNPNGSPTVPTIVTDVRFEFRKDPGKNWLIEQFISRPVFIGNDPFLNANLAPKK